MANNSKEITNEIKNKPTITIENTTDDPVFARKVREVKNYFLGRGGQTGLKSTLRRHENAENWLGKTQRKRVKKYELPRIQSEYTPFARSLERLVKVSNVQIQKTIVNTAFKLPELNGTRFEGSTHAILAAVDSYGRKASVFIISSYAGKLMLQKVQKKQGLGFPSGTIKPEETELVAGIREYFGETGGMIGAGVNIAPHNPLAIGEFELTNAIQGEKGVVLYVELPETEKMNAKTGPAEDPDEFIEKIYFADTDQIEQLIVEDGMRYPRMLHNSIMAFEVYLKFLQTLEYQKF